jgi:hypothetical protein
MNAFVETVQTEHNVEVLFCPVLPNNQKATDSFECSQASPACPSDKSIVKIKGVWGIDGMLLTAEN